MKINRAKKEGIIPEEMDTLCRWIQGREAIRIKRLKAYPPPWTDDPLLANYRWCNARRMDDKVSKWLLAWHQQAPEFPIQERVISATLGRLINWPDSLQGLPYPLPYNAERWEKHLFKQKSRGEKVFTGAYIINGALGGDKITQVTRMILEPMWKDRKDFPERPTSMQALAEQIAERRGLGPFIAGQVVADLRWIHPEFDWPDKHTWAPQGPGSVRGVNRLLGRTAKRGQSPPAREWLDIVRQGYAMAKARLPITFRRMELMDFQNCLCEYDKYSRLTKNEGSVRARYVAQ